MPATTGRLGSASSAFDQIVFGQDTKGLTQSITDTISFVQTVDQSSHSFVLEDTLSLVQTATGVRDVFASASDTISFTDATTKQLAISLSDAISFVDSASGPVDFPRSASDALSFVQDTYENIKNGVAASVLAFTQTVDEQGPIYITVTHFIPFASSGDSDLGVVNEALASVINFKQTAGRVISISVSQSISFSDTPRRFTGAQDTLNFVQVVTVGKGSLAADTILFTDAVVVQGLFKRSAANSLGLIQALTFSVMNGCTPKLYSPFVGTGDPGYTAPTNVPPTLGAATLTLTNPFVSPTSTLVLRNPAFGNRDQLSFSRVNRTTRGGTLVVFADPAWPKIEKLLVTISSLKQQQVDDYRTFLDNSLGKEIGLLDHENRQWRGFITNPDAEIVENSRNNRTISFEFEGSLA